MSLVANKLTKLHLRALGLSEYTVRQLVKDIPRESTTDNLSYYQEADVKAAIQQRLGNSRIKPQSRQQLKYVLNHLNGISNIIEVDFLRGRSPEERIAIVREQLAELETKEQQLNADNEQLIERARRAIAQR